MTDKQLRRLNRVQLLELLVEQEKENERLRQQLELTEEKLRSRDLAIKEAGSIAEAALKLNGVFEAAQAAADQYVQNVKVSEDTAANMKSKMESEDSDEAIEE